MNLRPEITMTNLLDRPHRRFNPLVGEWVLVSPQRTERPWQGKEESSPEPGRLVYDPDCYLCPGKTRAGGVRNPKYTSTFVFDNDFAALCSEPVADGLHDLGLLVARSERGGCRVVCFSDRHDLTLALMTPQEIRRVIDVWVEQVSELGRVSWINHVQIFE